MNAGHSVSKVWEDLTVCSIKQAFLKGLSTGLKAPTGKGKRLILVHIGSETGFVEGAQLILISKSSADYHEEMNGELFHKWFSSVLPKLEPNSVIVCDNASYHGVRCEKVPSISWKKCDIINWLNDKGVDIEGDMLKVELLQKVASIKHRYEKYVIDEMALFFDCPHIIAILTQLN